MELIYAVALFSSVGRLVVIVFKRYKYSDNQDVPY